MWPKRHIKLLVPPNAGGLSGFQALLELLGLAYQVEIAAPAREGLQVAREAVELSGESDRAAAGESGKPAEDGSSQEKEVAWWDEEIHIAGSNSFFPAGGCQAPLFTDRIVWPGAEEAEADRSRALAAGLQEMSPLEFLTELWQNEVLLPVFSPLALAGEKPLLWAILQEAGFAPSLLWQDPSGAWSGEVGSGLGWIVPGAWLEEIVGARNVGRRKVTGQGSWRVCSDRLDFYRIPKVSEQSGLSYLGSLPRRPGAAEETEACRSIAQALELGVAWRDVRQALSAFWPEKESGAMKQKEYHETDEGQGCQPDDFGWTEGPSGAQLSAEEHNDLEDRRAG